MYDDELNQQFQSCYVKRENRLGDTQTCCVGVGETPTTNTHEDCPLVMICHGSLQPC
jgi:hypothetical protein